MNDSTYFANPIELHYSRQPTVFGCLCSWSRPIRIQRHPYFSVTINHEVNDRITEIKTLDRPCRILEPKQSGYSNRFMSAYPKSITNTTHPTALKITNFASPLCTLPILLTTNTFSSITSGTFSPSCSPSPPPPSLSSPSPSSSSPFLF